MSFFEEHKADTLKRLGKAHSDVHLYIDQWFSKFGAKHRFVLHHVEGVEEIRQKFGDEGALAAECHIRLDCGGRIPSRNDYVTNKVDWMGYGEDAYKIIDKRSGIVILKDGKNA